MSDFDTLDTAAFLARYPAASDEALDAHLQECRLRRYGEWLIHGLTCWCRLGGAT
jgi:hypothetical protein